MDGDDVSTSGLQRLADLVMAKALEVKYADGKPKYDVRPGKRTGGRKRLAEDAGMDPGQLSRLLSGERMPDTRFLAGLAKALGTTVDALLADSDNYPPQRALREQRESLGSPSLTPDMVAASWGVDPARVRAFFEEELRKTPGATIEADQAGGAEAQG
jgi:transcriptional regulator with XRE-family HTH domain